jgi:hypothetical protein
MTDKHRLNVEVQIVNNNERLVRKSISFVTEGYTCFFNAQHLFLQLDNIERCFFDHLCEIMDGDNNRVYIVKEVKEAFAMLVKEISNGSVLVSVQSLPNVVKKLKSLGLIIAADTGRAYYVVNPKYVFKGTVTKRKWLLKNLIEQRFAEGLSIDELLPVRLEQFLS